MIEAIFAKINEAALSLFCELGIHQKTNFAYYKYTVEVLKFMEKKRRQMKYFQNLYMAAS